MGRIGWIISLIVRKWAWREAKINLAVMYFSQEFGYVSRGTMVVGNETTHA